MTCPKCGYEVRAGAKFCGHCGTPQSNAPASVQKKRTFPVFLRMGFIVLCAIALSLLFLLLFFLLLQKRDAARQAAQQELMAFADVLPSVSTVDLYEVTSYTTPNVTGVYCTSDGNYAIRAEEAGFDGGILTVILGIDSTGHECGISVDANYQTNGIGSHVADINYLSQFSGMDISWDVVLNGNYDGYTGATISSTALFNAINDCIYCYRELAYGTPTY